MVSKNRDNVGINLIMILLFFKDLVLTWTHLNRNGLVMVVPIISISWIQIAMAFLPPLAV